MSDLQTALFGIGALVVVGVIAFNWWQERQFKRRAELAFEREHDDVLMPAAPSPQAEPAARIEPRLDVAAAPAPVVRAVTRTAAALTIDSVIDYVVEVELAAPAPSAALHARLNQLATDWGKPVLAAGYDEASGDWKTGPIDWDEFWRVVKGNGPCNRERLAARQKAHADGAWVREAALAHADKQAGRSTEAA